MKLWCVMWVVSGWWVVGDVDFVYKYIDIYTSAHKGYTRSVNASNSLSRAPYRRMDYNDRGR